jgi:putative oxidoreductase
MAKMMNREQVIQVSVFLLRVVAGIMFMQVGGKKLFGWFGEPGSEPVKLMSQMGIGGILEFFGGIAILLGFVTRPVAFILCGEMAVAYFQFHAPHGIWPIQNHGEPAVLFCFIYLFFAAYGAGLWSLDMMLFNKKDPIGPIHFTDRLKPMGKGEMQHQGH